MACNLGLLPRSSLRPSSGRVAAAFSSPASGRVTAAFSSRASGSFAAAFSSPASGMVAAASCSRASGRFAAAFSSPASGRVAAAFSSPASGRIVAVSCRPASGVVPGSVSFAAQTVSPTYPVLRLAQTSAFAFEDSKNNIHNGDNNSVSVFVVMGGGGGVTIGCGGGGGGILGGGGGGGVLGGGGGGGILGGEGGGDGGSDGNFIIKGSPLLSGLLNLKRIITNNIFLALVFGVIANNILLASLVFGYIAAKGGAPVATDALVIARKTVVKELDDIEEIPAVPTPDKHEGKWRSLFEAGAKIASYSLMRGGRFHPEKMTKVSAYLSRGSSGPSK